MSLEAGSGVKSHYCKVQLYNRLRPGSVVGCFPVLCSDGGRDLKAASPCWPSSFQKSWSAPLPDKPSDRGLFGFPEDTGAAPITGAPAAHCLKLLRHGLENLAGSDQKHHRYVLVLDCTVADGRGDSFYGRARTARKLLIRQG
jgi:hypothetical protein